MAQGEETDGTTPTTPELQKRDDADADSGGDAGTPAAGDDEDLQSPELDVDELPVHCRASRVIPMVKRIGIPATKPTMSRMTPRMIVCTPYVVWIA